jgi:hypothetical protein
MGPKTEGGNWRWVVYGCIHQFKIKMVGRINISLQNRSALGKRGYMVEKMGVSKTK